MREDLSPTSIRRANHRAVRKNLLAGWAKIPARFHDLSRRSADEHHETIDFRHSPVREDTAVAYVSLLKNVRAVAVRFEFLVLPCAVVHALRNKFAHGTTRAGAVDNEFGVLAPKRFRNVTAPADWPVSLKDLRQLFGWEIAPLHGLAVRPH